MTGIVAVTSALTSALGRYDRAASDLMRAAGSGQDLAGPIADGIRAKEAVGAGIAVLKTQARNTKALLDIVV